MSTGIVTRRKSAMHIDNSYGIDVVAANTNLVSKRVLKGEPFSTQIVCDAGYSIYEITIKMGGVDITSTAYDATYNMISIPSVTDDVDIECYAMHTLPSDYIRVDGIKNPSNAWIDTAQKLGANAIAYVDCTRGTATDGVGIFASRPTGITSRLTCGIYMIGGKVQTISPPKNASGSSPRDLGVSPALGERFSVAIDKGNGRIYYNNTLKATYSSPDKADTHNMCLFAQSNQYPYEYAANSAGYIIHSATIKNETSYARYYIPCLNASGVAGFWDAAQGIFQGSSNSTAFEATIEGAVVNPTLPTGYTLLKGCKNARYAYFDTGYKCNKNTVVSVDVTPQNTPYIVTSKAVGNSATVGTGFFYDANGLRVFYNANAQILGYTTKGKRIRLKEDNANGKVYLDGKQVYSFTRTTTADAKNLYAYVYPVGGASEGRDTIIYWIIIKEGDEFKRVYVAARNSSNQVGWYDTVNDTFTVSAAGTAPNAPFVAVEYGT